MGTDKRETNISQLIENTIITNDKIDIVFSTFNRLTYVKRCFESFFKTVDHPYCLNVYDDASFDGTRDYLLSLKDQNLIHRLILSDLNLGLALGRNRALKLCTSRYVCICDSDVYFLDAWLADLVRTLDTIKDIGIITAFDQRISPNVLFPNRPQKTLGDLTVEYRKRYGTSNWLIRREILVQNGYFQGTNKGRLHIDQFYQEDAEN